MGSSFSPLVSFWAPSVQGSVAAAVTRVAACTGFHWVMLLHWGFPHRHGKRFFALFWFWLVTLAFSLFNRKENAPRILVRDSILWRETLRLNLCPPEVRGRARMVATLLYQLQNETFAWSFWISQYRNRANFRRLLRFYFGEC